MRVTDLDTPAVVIDFDRVEANLARVQALADGLGLRLRPHVKTHKLPVLARLQMDQGAVGITCQKVGEAEAMAEGGLDDILITYNILGAAKLDRLARLHSRITVAVVADSAETVSGYASHFTDPSRPLSVLVECDTGAARCGVQTPAAALALARNIAGSAGLRFGGLMTYPPRGDPARTELWLAEAVAILREADLPPPVVSNGGTPDLSRLADVPSATEHRPGTYVYGDRMQVSFGAMRLEDCALTLRATVVSRPTPDRAVLDAGSKTLAADLCALPGHGHIVEYPEAVIASLSEEHGVVDLSASPRRPVIGEVLSIVPNHVCVVSNLFDHVNLARDGVVVERLRVAARGSVS